MKRNSCLSTLRTSKLLRLLAAAAFTCLLPSCITVPEKEHVYDYGDAETDVSLLPNTRPESYEGNPFGNFPQSR